jgi:hypothetical protein
MYISSKTLLNFIFHGIYVSPDLFNKAIDMSLIELCQLSEQQYFEFQELIDFKNKNDICFYRYIKEFQNNLEDKISEFYKLQFKAIMNCLATELCKTNLEMKCVYITIMTMFITGNISFSRAEIVSEEVIDILIDEAHKIGKEISNGTKQAIHNFWDYEYGNNIHYKDILLQDNYGAKLCNDLYTQVQINYNLKCVNSY